MNFTIKPDERLCDACGLSKSPRISIQRYDLEVVVCRRCAGAAAGSPDKFFSSLVFLCAGVEGTAQRRRYNAAHPR